MSLIERCRYCGSERGSYTCVESDRGAFSCTNYDPAPLRSDYESLRQQLAGAVEALREIAEAAEAQVEKLDPAINSAWVAGKARDAISRSGKNRSDAPG